jgi:NTE family protein
MRLAPRCVAWVAMLGAVSAVAQTTPPAATQGTSVARPRVGLVLSGGGARGGAHIGVLRVLEEMRVPVDVIVGTSAGSIVGSAYASGLPLKDIEEEMKGLSTATLFHDTDRDETPYRHKADDAANYIGPEMGVSREGLLLPKGAVAGVSLEAVLRRLTRRQTSTNFDQLPIRFRAVATDLTSAEMVVIEHGQLALAARASMAIPGAVNPVEIDGRLLVDGGLKRNLPVDVARRMGADVVIAVNIGTPLLKREHITSLLSVTDQVLRILTDSNVEQSLKELTPRDLLITPDLKDISSASFDRLSEAAQQGEAAARAAGAQLARYSLSDEAYRALQASRAGSTGDTALRIDEVRVVGAKAVNAEVILAAMDTRAGALLDHAVLDQDLKRIYSRGDFESVNYAVVDEPGTGRVLVIEANEKSWGPNYLRVGLSLSSDFEGNAFFNMLVSHRWSWLNPLGAEWRNDLQFGQVNRLTSEWYQPLTSRQRAFLAPRIEVKDEPFDIYSDVNDKRILRFRLQYSELGLDAGLPLGTWGEARLGLLRGRVRLSDDTSIVSAADVAGQSVDIGGILARVQVDRLDNLRFPRAGFAGGLRLFFSRPALGADDAYIKAEAQAQAATHRGPHTLRAALRSGENLKDGELPSHEIFQLGGFLQLSGYKTGQLLATDYRFGRVVYNYRLSGPGFLDGMYAGASLETARMTNVAFLTSAQRTRRNGASLYFALDTPIGPLYLAAGFGDSGRRAAYLYLGQP